MEPKLSENTVDLNLKKSFENKSILLILIVVALIFTCIAGFIIYFSTYSEINTKSMPNLNSSDSNASKEISEAIKIPMASDSAGIRTFSLMYSIEGTYLGIRQEGGKKVLLTDIKLDNIPEFYITDKTHFYRSTTGQQVTDVKEGDLKFNQKIRIGMIYSFRSKGWYLSYVRILKQDI